MIACRDTRKLGSQGREEVPGPAKLTAWVDKGPRAGELSDRH